MRIGIIPVLDRSWGGVYQYSVTLLTALAGSQESGDQYVVFVPRGAELPSDIAVLPFEWREMPAGASRLGRWWTCLPVWVRARLDRPAAFARKMRRPRGASPDTRWHDFFAASRVDLLLFAIENDIAPTAGVPYLVVIHDLQHALQPDLPEFADRVEWERREQRIRGAIEHAAGVIVDSEVGKADVLACYRDTGIRPELVTPLPFVSAHYVPQHVAASEIERVRQLYRLPERYLFYPAQFWPHKNHRRVVEALAQLAGQGVSVDVVFAGSAGDSALRVATLREVEATAASLGVTNLVHYIGYVPDADVAALYAGALALVMPTFFGPTNIPILEAWQLGCPVITSDIRGVAEQAGDAALLVDPTSATSIADAIRRMAEDSLLREELIARGRERVAANTLEGFTQRLGAILDAAKQRVAAGRHTADE